MERSSTGQQRFPKDLLSVVVVVVAAAGLEGVVVVVVVEVVVVVVYAPSLHPEVAMDFCADFSVLGFWGQTKWSSGKGVLQKRPLSGISRDSQARISTNASDAVAVRYSMPTAMVSHQKGSCCLGACSKQGMERSGRDLVA